MQKKPQDITLYPRAGYLIYIDGYTAKILGQKPSKDQQGNDVWEMTLIPSEELVKRYNIKTGDTEDSAIYTQQIPFELILQLNADPYWNRWLYLKTYKHEETYATGVLEGSKQQKQIQELKQTIMKEQAKAECALESQRLMETNLSKYMDRNIKPFIEQMGPVITRLINKDKQDARS